MLDRGSFSFLKNVSIVSKIWGSGDSDEGEIDF